MAGLLAFLSYLVIEMTALGCSPIQSGRILWKERMRDIVHRRGSKQNFDHELE